MIVVGLLFAFFKQDTFIILATAFIGAYAIILGIDMFARTGFADSVRSFMDGNHDIGYQTNRDVYIMLGAMIILFIIGVLFQRRYHTNHFGPTVGPEAGEKRRRFWGRRRLGDV